MDNKKIIIIVVVLLLLIGAGVYAYKNYFSKKDPMPAPLPAVQTMTKEELQKKFNELNSKYNSNGYAIYNLERALQSANLTDTQKATAQADVDRLRAANKEIEAQMKEVQAQLNA